MRRREFISLISGAAAGWSATVRAQQIQDMRRVAILTAFAEPEPEVQRWFATLVQQLRDLGWVEGRNIQIDTHWATIDVGRLNRAAMELIDSKPDVILANGPLPVATLRPMTSGHLLSPAGAASGKVGSHPNGGAGSRPAGEWSQRE
jgi:putative ABC transport system substrate-binding protein